MVDEPRPDRPYVVETRPARPPGRSRLPLAALAVAVVAVVALSAWGVLVAPGPAPTPVPATPTPGTPAAPSIAPDRSFPPPADDGSGIAQLTLPTTRDALAALGQLGGWGQCPIWRGLPDGGVVSAAAVEAALHGTNAPDGGAMHTVADTLGQPRKVWIGGSVDDAVRGFGGSLVVRVDEDPDAVWTGIPDGGSWAAVRLAPLTARGATAWQVAARAVPAPYCGVGNGGQPAEVVDVPADQDPLVRLFAAAGWNVCRTWERSELSVTPSPEAIDGAAVAAGLAPADSAWVTVPLPGAYPISIPVWLGIDPATAGTRLGSRLVALSAPPYARRAWIASSLDGRPYAAPFDVLETPGGRTAWIPLEGAAGVTGDCSIEGSGSPGGVVDPPPGAPVVELVRGPDPQTAIADRYDWTSCRMTIRDVYPPELDGAVVDEAAAAAFGDPRSASGWLDVPGAVGRVWIGEDVVALAQAANAPFVAWRGDAPFAWLADATRADEWTVRVTPGGLTAWWPTGGAEWPDACPARPSGAPVVVPDGVRSVACAVDRARCAEAIEAARAIAPGAFGTAVDVAVGPSVRCPANARCAATLPTQPVIVTAMPAGFTRIDEARAFSVGARELSGVNRELGQDEWGDAVLALLSRPSLDPPAVPPSTGAIACPAAGIEGVLGGSPWDPRVAWVGPNTVRWPAGTEARFLPSLVLVDAFGGVYDAGDTVQVSGTATAAGGFTGCAITLVESVSPVPSAP